VKSFDSSFAGPPKVNASYRLESQTKGLQITFLVSGDALCHPEVLPNDFFEGLWKFDCGELWLYSAETGRYLEFNLAPNGAWWSMVFESPRVRAKGCGSPKCITSGTIQEGFWQATLFVSFEEIERCLGACSGWSGNVTLVIGGCPDNEVPLENLHTIVPLKAVDFHRPQDWVPLESLVL
jgi:hypothetical protein